jgi:hypothetical protein
MKKRDSDVFRNFFRRLCFSEIWRSKGEDLLSLVHAAKLMQSQAL